MVAKAGSTDLKAFGEDGSGIAVESVWRGAPCCDRDRSHESTRDVLRYVAMTRARSVLMMVGEETGLKRATNV